MYCQVLDKKRMCPDINSAMHTEAHLHRDGAASAATFTSAFSLFVNMKPASVPHSLHCSRSTAPVPLLHPADTPSGGSDMESPGTLPESGKWFPHWKPESSWYPHSGHGIYGNILRRLKICRNSCKNHLCSSLRRKTQCHSR